MGAFTNHTPSWKMTLEHPRFTRERNPDQKHVAEIDVTDTDTLLLYPFHPSLSLPLICRLLALFVSISTHCRFIYISLSDLYLFTEQTTIKHDVMNALKVEGSGLSKCYRRGGGKGQGSRQLLASYQLILL